jgi:hypothetical protein
VSHLRSADGTVLCDHDEGWEPERHLHEISDLGSHEHNGHAHDHSHGLIDRSILRSRAGIRAVSWSLAILTITALAQAFIYSRTLSVALLADLIHNFGDALTAIPLGLAFFSAAYAANASPASASYWRSSSAPWSRSCRRSSASSIHARSRTCGYSPPPA